VRAADVILAVRPVIRALEALGVPYYIDGSLASSVYGIARATMDVDLVAGLETGQAGLLTEALQSNYYADDTAIAEAIERRSSFNPIHLATSIKIDVFVPPEGDYQQAAMERRRQETLEEPGESYWVCRAEDIILAKLQCFELGGRLSERQWLDVIGVIKVQAGALDADYLKRWAGVLRVSALLGKAFADAGVPLP